MGTAESRAVNRYTGFVVGAGRIGALYDDPADAKTLTHCHAFLNHPRVELAGVVDSDPIKGAAAGERWRTSHYRSLADAFRGRTPDIVSIATPTATHLEMVEEVVSHRPSFVFLEKPVGARPGEADEIALALNRGGVRCMVNYPRSFDPVVQDTARAALSGAYGEFITGSAFYAKGMRNNGSHLVSLVQTVLGSVSSVDVLDTRYDHTAEDPSADVFMRLERGGTFHLIPVDERAYSITDVTLLFRDKRVHFRNFGLEVCVSSRREDPVFPGYWDLTDQENYVQTGLSNSMDRAVEQIVRFLDHGTPYDSDMESAIRAERVVDEIAGIARAKFGTREAASIVGGATA